ncbi:MAG: two-component system, OmpR family, phosphate regulon sensor histidine kinase PhoR [Thermosediminibacterales bacterium]|nr:two-component system, OmpR family, phosphate regulon sensor histidine kinase PhoR [Thermosediminibacterales bacterium]MDK2835288.1 two-component system, OmpR family, phosphate regulon sensor histidine kinase PhoR [Thermosediminibacterales bacterium]
MNMLKRLMGAFTALILIGVLLTGSFSMEIAKNNYYDMVEEKLKSNARIIQKELTEDLSKGQKLDYEKLSEEYSRITEARITIIDINGKVLGDSELAAEKMENHKDRPEVIQALEKGFGKSSRWSNSLNKNMLYIALPLKKEKEIAGILRMALPLNDIYNIQHAIWRYIFFSAFAGILVAVILGYRYLSNVTRPIQEITEMAGNIAAGNFDKRVKIKTNDEIGKLGMAFNYMTEKLNETIEELKNDKSKMEAILTSSINGVIAVDNRKKAMIINPVAEKLLDIQEKDFVGKDLFEIARNKEAAEAIERILNLKEASSMEFELTWPENKILKFFSAPIRLQDRPLKKIGNLIIIQDITDIRKLEKMRSDFVANVTHELRTPLTSIRGFIETLKEGAINDESKRERFLDIIDIETERLERLIEDILLLSEIENKPFSIPKNKIKVEKVIKEEIITIFNKKAEEKNILLDTYFQDNLPVLCMNKDRFKQMMINLIDNAIKYTPEGGKVLVSAYCMEDCLVLKVRDTGIGIPKEHLDRLFERFYRVDKGRSRKLGGTGLGLAIVKHIVLSLKGNISVSSEPGVGTEFKIEIPLKRGE